MYGFFAQNGMGIGYGRGSFFKKIFVSEHGRPKKVNKLWSLTVMGYDSFDRDCTLSQGARWLLSVLMITP